MDCGLLVSDLLLACYWQNDNGASIPILHDQIFGDGDRHRGLQDAHKDAVTINAKHSTKRNIKPVVWYFFKGVLTGRRFVLVLIIVSILPYVVYLLSFSLQSLYFPNGSNVSLGVILAVISGKHVFFDGVSVS